MECSEVPVKSIMKVLACEGADGCALGHRGAGTAFLEAPHSCLCWVILAK